MRKTFVRLLAVLTVLNATLWTLDGNAAALKLDTYASCSQDAVGPLDDLADYHAKVPLDDVLKKKSHSLDEALKAKNIYKFAEGRGLTAIGLSVLGTYAFCMRDIPASEARSTFVGPSPLIACGEQAAMDYRLLSDFKKGLTVEDIQQILPEIFREKMNLYADMIKNKSLDDAVAYAAAGTSSCIDAAMKK